MKKNKKAMITISVIAVIAVLIGFLYLNIKSDKKKFDKETQTAIIDSISNWDLNLLNEYSDEKINLIPPIGENSQMFDELSNSKKVKEFVAVFKKEREKQEEFYKKNTSIKQKDIVFDKDKNRYTQTILISSYSLTGYNIVYNDLLWYCMDLLANSYTEKGITKENAEPFDEIDAMFRAYAIVKTNEHLDVFNEKFEREISLIWNFDDKNNKWVCENLNTELNNLIDPERIVTNDTTELFDKYHTIAYKIMDEISNDKNFDPLNPFNINNIRK